MSTANDSSNRAVAVLYDQVSAPRVMAKGDDELAERIIAVAKEHNVPIREEPELVQLLSEVALGDEIPEILYIAVAEVLSFAYMLKGKVPHSR
ncbi:MAG: flagellar biosynthesis protein [Planctomycetota bacterium]|jgi:flagellar biosynthesis protein